MRLSEMGPVGREARIASDAPSRAGESGTVTSIARDRTYVEFQDGKSEWITNKHIVGLRDKQYSDPNE